MPGTGIFDATNNVVLLYIDIGLSIVSFAIVFFVLRSFIKRRFLFLYVAIFFILKLSSFYFDLVLFGGILDLIMIAIVVTFCVVYSQEMHRRFASGKHKRGSYKEISVDQKETLIKKLSDAVLDLSATRTGALITIERGDNLEDYIKSGQIVDAPISSELLRTIFYEGTPLHDGAVIIREDVICAASVYFTPTVKALNGRYGARHRAAVGISETVDALTVVVSEETGRISFAIKGELIAVNRDNFARNLSDYLS